MNSNIITFDYQSGQIRRDLTREAATRQVEIYVPVNAESASAQVGQVRRFISLAKSLFVNKQPAGTLQFR